MAFLFSGSPFSKLFPKGTHRVVRLSGIGECSFKKPLFGKNNIG
jgi:hypothetical protein